MAKAVIEMGYGDGKSSHQAEVSVGDDDSEPLAGFYFHTRSQAPVLVLCYY